jgi:hypothetical protein
VDGGILMKRRQAKKIWSQSLGFTGTRDPCIFAMFFRPFSMRWKVPTLYAATRKMYAEFTKRDKNAHLLRSIDEVLASCPVDDLAQ